MSNWITYCARLALVFVFLLGVLFVAPQSAQAQEIITDGRVPAGTVIENDTFIYGDDVVIDGDVDGDLFAFGSSVTVNGNVSGSILTVAGTIDVNGEVGGSLYSIGRALNLGPASAIGRNVYYVGIRLVFEEGFTVGRDLVGLSLSAQIDGQVGRDVKLISGLLSIADILTSPETESGDSGDEPAPTDESDASDSESSSAGSLVLTSAGFSKPAFKGSSQTSDDSSGLKSSQKQSVTTQAVIDWLVGRLLVFITLLVIGGVALWLMPTRMYHWSDTVKGKPGLSTGFGLLSLVVVANAVAIAILLAILIIVIGLWLGAIAFWNLAFIFWAVAFSLLVLGYTLFTVFVFYVSKAIVAYLVGLLILKRISKRAAEYKLLVLALGLLIYVILAGLPYIGWLVSLLAMVLGLGAILVAYRDKKYAAIRGDCPEELPADVQADDGDAEPADDAEEVADEAREEPAEDAGGESDEEPA